MDISTLPTDANGHPVNRAGWAFKVEHEVTFAGGTANAIGDLEGTHTPFTLFEVTGAVLIRVVAHCTTDLVSAGGGKLEVGFAGNTAAIIAQTTATAIDAGEVWRTTTPDIGGVGIANIGEYVAVKDVLGTVSTADITAGVIKFTALWYPISADGNVSVVLTDTGHSSASASISASVSPSISASFSPSISPSFSPSISPSLSASISQSISPSLSASISSSISPSASLSASISPSLSASISSSVSPSSSISPSASLSASISASLSASLSPSISPSISPSPSGG